MANFNKVMLMGNLTRDPEVRYTPSGMAVADLRLAVNRRYRSADGQERDETCFVNVTVWGKQGETCGQYLKRGRPVFIEGRLKFDEWEKEGQKFNRLSVVAERVQFLGDGGGRGGQQAEPDRESGGGGVPVAAPRPAAPARELHDEAAQDDHDTNDGEPEPLEADTDNLPF
jgi:single-strand DNA-binding protein